MSVIITSFKVSDKILKSFPDMELYSVSRWQPKGYFYDVLEFLGAYDKHGKRLRLRGRSEDVNPIGEYKKEWLEYITKNWENVDKWLKGLDNDVDIMLCCWCPYSKATKNQMRIYNTFVCHTGLIGRLINKYRPDIQLWLDHDHAINLIDEWKPKSFRTVDF